MSTIFTWISVLDRLPPDGKKVLLFDEHAGMIVGKFYKEAYPGKDIWTDEESIFDYVTWWGELPERPGK